MSSKKILTRRKVIKAIDGSAGVMLTISKRCECAYDTVWRFFNNPKNSEFKAMLISEREKIIDVAENKLFKKVNEEDSWAIKYVLSTIGANRGYQEKQQIEHFGAAGIKIEFAEPGKREAIDVDAKVVEEGNDKIE